MQSAHPEVDIEVDTAISSLINCDALYRNKASSIYQRTVSTSKRYRRWAFSAVDGPIAGERFLTTYGI